MLSRIMAVARLTALDQLGRGVGVAYGAIWFCSQILPSLLAHSLSAADPLAMQSKVPQSLALAQTVAIFLAAMVAARSVPQEIEQRTLCAVMIRPIARHEYLLGRLSGVALVFKVSMALMLATAALHMVILGGTLPLDAVFMWLGELCSGVAWIGIMLVVAAISSYQVALGGFITLWIANKIVGLLPDSLGTGAQLVKSLFYYLSKVDTPTTPSWGACLTLADSLGYGALIFILGAWLFQRGDLRLRS